MKKLVATPFLTSIVLEQLDKLENVLVHKVKQWTIQKFDKR